MPTRKHPHARSGAAAVEMALVVNFVMVPMMIGTWEVGRLTHVQQLVANAAREGCRVAAQGVTVQEDGSLIQIVSGTSLGSAPSSPTVRGTVYECLYGAGLTDLRWADVTCSFTFMDSPTGAVSGATEPYQGIKNQRFQVSVSIPWSKVRWSVLGVVNPTAVSYVAEWQMLVDDAFTINTNLPGGNPG